MGEKLGDCIGVKREKRRYGLWRKIRYSKKFVTAFALRNCSNFFTTWLYRI